MSTGRSAFQPVVYRDSDWSLSEKRRRTVAAIPGARAETVPDGGHLLSLDQPERRRRLSRGSLEENASPLVLSDPHTMCLSNADSADKGADA